MVCGELYMKILVVMMKSRSGIISWSLPVLDMIFFCWIFYINSSICTSIFSLRKLEGDVQVVRKLDDARWKVYEVPRLRRSTTVASREIDLL